MKRYSIFHPLVLSFFSKSLYRDVAKNWRGTGLLYLAIVLALVWIPTIIKGHLAISAWVDGDSKEITKQIPAITISKGQVSTDVTTPYSSRTPKPEMTSQLLTRPAPIHHLRKPRPSFY
jgi:hypothetical protein